MVKNVIMKLNSSTASGPDFIPVVVLKNCELELFYILAELFSKWLKESCFIDYWKVSFMLPEFKNVGERSIAKNYRPVSLLSAVTKVFEKLVNNTIAYHFEKRGFFLISFWQLFLIESLGLLTGLQLLELKHLTYPRLLTGFSMMVFFTNSKFASAIFSLVCFLSLNKSTCQARKNVFHFTSKALFDLEKTKSQNSTFLNFMTSSNI